MPFGDEDLGMAHIGFTAPYNMSGQPAGTRQLPASPATAVRSGVQVAGRRFDDVGVLRRLHWYENSRPPRLRRTGRSARAPGASATAREARPSGDPWLSPPQAARP